MITIKPQEELEIRVRADEAFKHCIRGVAHALPGDYTTDDIVNVFRQEGYVKGYSGALINLMSLLFRKCGQHEDVMDFIKEYISFANDETEVKKPSEQKPTVWGEEDECHLQDAIYAAEKTYSEHCGREELITWLKNRKIAESTDLRTWKYIVDTVLTSVKGIGQYLDDPETERIAKRLQERFGQAPKK